MRSQCSCDIRRYIHELTALIIQADHTTAVLQLRWIIGQDTGISLSCLTATTCQRCTGILCQEAGTIAFADNTCHIGLLFHSWISTQGTRHILEITHLIPLVLSKSHQFQHTVSAGGHTAVYP